MKLPTLIIGYSFVAVVLFSAQICRAEAGLFASVGNNLAAPEGETQLVVPNLDDAWSGDSLRDQKRSGFGRLTNRSAKTGGFSAAGATGPQNDITDRAGKARSEMNDSDSSFQHYLLLVLPIGVSGLVLIAAGVVQWWRRRGLKHKWLFPAAGDGEQPFSIATSSAPLIAKRQRESIQEDLETEKRAQQRRAA